MKPKKPIESLILTLRNRKVILDADLAELYGVPTKVFNQARKRNTGRSPEDFFFQLTASEWKNLKSQIVTSNLEAPQIEGRAPNSSRIAMSSRTELVTICDHLPEPVRQASRSQIATLNNFINHPPP
jgi:hypothetical protein